MNIFQYGLIYLTAILVLPITAQGGEGWHTNLSITKSFIKNAGQYDHILIPNGSLPILFTADLGRYKIYFDRKGFTYHFETINKERRETEPIQKKITNPVFVRAEWDKSDVQDILSLESDDVSHNYGQLQVSDKTNTKGITTLSTKGYKKIIYKNLYPEIDVEFSFHQEKGIKYNFIIHPGADISQIVMNYTGAEELMIEYNHLLIKTSAYDIVDAAPVTYQEEKLIPSYYKLNTTSISFNIGNYETDKPLIIDPWQSVINFPSDTNRGLYLKTDDSGNIYLFGGVINGQDSGLTGQVQKFDPSGNLLWTYQDPVALMNSWHGRLEVNKSTGDLYLGSGSEGYVSKIKTTGNKEWVVQSVIREPWLITFNAGKDQLLVAGNPTVINSFPNHDPAQYHINPINGSAGSGLSFLYPQPGPPWDEVRAVAPDPAGGYVYMSLFNLTRVCSDLSVVYVTPHNHSFLYGGPIYDGSGNGNFYTGDNTNGANNGIAVGIDYIYTTNGDSLNQWLKADGSYIRAAKIPGGTHEGGSGILVDKCRNVFVGSDLGLFKYDENLTFLDSVTLPGVHDIDFNINGEIVATGRGYVASVAIENCGLIAPIIPGENTVSPDAEICSGDSLQLFATGGSRYIWAPSKGLDDSTSRTPIASPSEPTTYFVTIYDTCRIITDSVRISLIQPEKIISVSGDTTICWDGFAQLQASGGNTYSWSPAESLDNSGLSNPKANPETTTTYYVTILSDSCNSPLVGSVTVFLDDCSFFLDIPAAFTPNEDGKNDLFYILGDGIMSFDLKIYNRWGKEIFESNSINNGWDGKINNENAELGIYIYQLKVTDSESTVYDKLGKITLIR